MENVLIYYSSKENKRRVTIIGDFISEYNILYITASLNSKKDQFNKKIGKTIALGRMLKGKYLTVKKTKEPFLSWKEFREIAEQISNKILSSSKVTLVFKENKEYSEVY